MSDTARESSYTAEVQAKPLGPLSKLNPLALVAAEIHSLSEKNKPHTGQPAHSAFKSEQAKEDFSDTKDLPLINEDLTVKKEVLRREDIKSLNSKIDQIEDTCGRMILEIYSNSKNPPRRRSEAQQAVKQLPVNVTTENQKNVETLFYVLDKDGYIGSRNIEHSGLPSFYDDAYGRAISDGISKADPALGKTLNETLNYFKGQVKTAKNEFDKIEKILYNEPMVSTSFDYMSERKEYSNEKLRSIASHAVNVIIALERSRNWLNKLDVPDIDKSYEDIVMERRQNVLEQQQAREQQLTQQQQQIARAQEAVEARPYKDSLVLLSPYGDLADHVKAVDDQVIKILQEVNPQDLQELFYDSPQTVPTHRSPVASVLRSVAGMVFPLPIPPLGHVNGPIGYNVGEDPFQPYNEFKVRADLRKLSEAIKAVKEDLKTDATVPVLFAAERESSKDKYSPVLNDTGKPEINAEVQSRLSKFRINATNMFTQPNKTEGELEKMCDIGETVNREELKKEVNSIFAEKDYQALRSSCNDVLTEVKDVSDKYETIKRGSMLTP